MHKAATATTALYGNALGNVLKGGGATTSVGASGDDILKGGKGNDKLQGDAGNDILNGGGDVDHYVFKQAPGSGVDTITKFQSGERIDLDNAAIQWNRQSRCPEIAVFHEGIRRQGWK